MATASWRVRNFEPDRDFPAYIAFLNEIMELSGTGEPTSREAQLEYADLFTINLDADRLIVENPDKAGFVAAHDVWRISSNPSAASTLVVHPAWRRRGIGSALLAAGKEHAKEIGATAIDAYAKPDDEIAQSFLDVCGFERAGNYVEMKLTLDAPLPRPKLPEKYTAFTYAELKLSKAEKLDLLFEAAQEFWGDLWGHNVAVDEDMGRQAVVTNVLGHYSEEAMFFFFAGENYVGHDRVSFTDTDGEKVGYVGIPGIRRDYRSPELFAALAQVGHHYLSEQGCTELKLSDWGSSQETLKAFESSGFRQTFHELGYQLTL